MENISTEIITTSESDPDEEALDRAAKIIAGGGLVAFPTETVYGLGGNAFDPDAARRIYEAKGRPSDNPLIVHIDDPSKLSEVAASVPPEAEKLAERFMPGPLTLILPKREEIPDETTGGLTTVAVRCPDNRIARELIRRAGCPIAAPSANRSGRPSTTRFAHVLEDLDGRVDAIIDGGDAKIGLESTIVDLTGEVPAVLRPGYITVEELRDTLGEVWAEEAVEMVGGLEFEKKQNELEHPKAPGMKYRHYAPKGDLYLVQGMQGDVVRYINKLADAAQKEGHTVGILATTDTKERYRYGTVLDIGAAMDEEQIAAALFDTLRQFDAIESDVIYAEYVGGMRLGAALHNRLRKAAAGMLYAPRPMQSNRRRKILFVEGHGNARSAMASALFERLYEGSDMEAYSRGIVVQFPEPLNQKTEAVMVSNGLAMEGFSSRQLADSEIEQDTMIFAMEERQRKQIIAKFPSATEANTYLLSSYVGDELEIMDPYGGTLQTYGICFEVIRASIQKLSDKILEEKTYG
ncbi:MAG: threonylcarbamoyl-AMP synthase [Lachnospiraceae bacterium]|nr:threonylcarbamoyl-AMP synthase [Lachnospiraceae bacterium]